MIPQSDLREATALERHKYTMDSCRQLRLETRNEERKRRKKKLGNNIQGWVGLKFSWWENWPDQGSYPGPLGKRQCKPSTTAVVNDISFHNMQYFNILMFWDASIKFILVLEILYIDSHVDDNY